MIYAVDTNILIAAAKHYYAFDIAPTFWDQFLEQITDGNIVVIDKIRDEIYKGNDELKDWLKNHCSTLIVPTDKEEIIREYRLLMKWSIDHSQYRPEAKAEFAVVADAWLLAFTKAKNCTLVTDEKMNRDAKKRISIPNVCNEFELPYISTYDLLRNLKIKL